MKNSELVSERCVDAGAVSYPTTTIKKPKRIYVVVDGVTRFPISSEESSEADAIRILDPDKALWSFSWDYVDEEIERTVKKTIFQSSKEGLWWELVEDAAATVEIRAWLADHDSIVPRQVIVDIVERAGLATI